MAVIKYVMRIWEGRGTFVSWFEVGQSKIQKHKAVGRQPAQARVTGSVTGRPGAPGGLIFDMPLSYTEELIG